MLLINQNSYKFDGDIEDPDVISRFVDFAKEKKIPNPLEVAPPKVMGYDPQMTEIEKVEEARALNNEAIGLFTEGDYITGTKLATDAAELYRQHGLLLAKASCLMSPAASYLNLILVDVSETGSREYGSDDPSNEESEMGSTGSEEEHEIENPEEIENQLELLNVVIDSAEKAIAIYEKNNQFDSVCESIRFLNPIMDKGLDLYYDLKQQENLNSLEKRQNELRKKYIKAFLREHNEPEIADAHYVESGAVVFSRSGQDIHYLKQKLQSLKKSMPEKKLRSIHLM